MKKICVIGHYGNGKNLLNGQTIKTKIVTNELEKQFGTDEVSRIDTHGGVKAYIKLPFQMLNALISCENVIIFPAHNGLRVIAPMLTLMNYLFERRLHYVVIGGWLPKFLEDKPRLAKSLKKFDGIYVETNSMKQSLKKQGFTNIRILPNCKKMCILKEEELVYHISEPYKICTFSRVMKEKGIEDAVTAIKAINENFGRIVYELDIYGQVDSEQTEWFENLKKTFPCYIQYKGCVPYNKTVDIVKNYYLLIFPTRFFTEGIPGTIIDAYSAGVPVISSRWESFSDIITESETGYGYQIGDKEDLISCLTIAMEPSLVNRMKVKCLHNSQRYLPSDAISLLLDNI